MRGSVKALRLAADNGDGMAVAAKRQRLDPQVRRDLILDEAAGIVIADGVSAVSMEGLGRAAGISKALVYNYFPSRAVLLEALLVREYRVFQQGGLAAAKDAPDFEALVRVTTRAYLQHVATRGVLIQRLLNEPVVAQALRGTEGEERKLTVRYFARAMTREFGVDEGIAATATDLLMGLTGAAGDYLYRSGGDIAPVEDMVVAMIMAAVRDLAAPSGGRAPRATPRVAML